MDTFKSYQNNTSRNLKSKSRSRIDPKKNLKKNLKISVKNKTDQRSPEISMSPVGLRKIAKIMHSNTTNGDRKLKKGHRLGKNKMSHSKKSKTKLSKSKKLDKSSGQLKIVKSIRSSPKRRRNPNLTYEASYKIS
jgi:hypothetical protein